ncbi:MAG: restriction endonuclease [Lachnospiraceae bacterium]|nr:restriction endonuclease [Lachnospiraceae bacterium]
MRLEEICTVFADGDWIESKDQSDEGIRLVQTGNIGEGIYFEKESRAKYISEDTFLRLKCTEIFSGDILVSRLPEPVGRACIIPEKKERMITAVDCTICRPNESIVNKEYLCYFMRSDAYYNRLLGNVTGTTRKRISRKNLGNVELHIPSKDEQGNVVKKLNCLVKAIDSRKKELELLDNLIKSRFVEMFGDPEINPMRWNIVTIGKVILNSESGWSGNGKQREKLPGEIAVLKVSAVTKGYFIPKECKVLDDQKNIKKFVYPQKGDLLFSRANTKEMVGSTAIITEDYPELILPDKLWKIRFTNSTNVFYMKYILSSRTVREKFSAVSTGTSGSMYNVSMEKFRAIKIPLPPIDLQEQFAAFVHQVDKLKVANILKVDIDIIYGSIEKSRQFKIVGRWSCMWHRDETIFHKEVPI